MTHARTRLRRAALLREARARQQPDGEIRPRPFEVKRVEVELVEPARVLPDLLDAVVPRLRRVGLVEPADVRDVLPQLLERGAVVELGIDDARPSLRRKRRERPRDRAIVDDLEALLERRYPVAAGAGGIQP